MNLLNVAAAIFGAVALTGTVFLVCQIYTLVKTDAKTRGIKNARLWGALSLSDRSGGLILYLIHRRQYPVIDRTAADEELIQKSKKAVGIEIVFILVGVIGFVLCVAPWT